MSDLLLQASPVRASESLPTTASKPSGSRTRSGGIDAVRVFGLLAVIAGHVWLNSDPLRAAIFPWHVPVFFFLTGYLWRTNRTFIGETKKRFTSLIVPYLAWLAVAVGVYFTVEFVTADTSWRELGQTLLGETGHRPFHTFWFVSALFLVALIYQPLAKLPPAAQGVLAVAAMWAGSLFGDQLASTPYSAGTALYCVGFVMLGAIARRWRPLLRSPLVTGVLLLMLGALAGAAGVVPVDLRPGELGTLLLSGFTGAIISFGLVLIFEAIFNRLPAWCSKLATLLAAPALVVLLLHPLLLWAFQTPDDGSITQYLLIVGISWGVGLIVVCSPLARLFAGIPTRRTV